MRASLNPNSRHTASPEAKPARKTVLFGTLFSAAVLLSVVFALKSLKHSPPPPASAPAATALKTASSSGATLTAVRHDFAPPVATPAPAVPSVAAPSGPRSAHQLMAELTELSGMTGPLTKEQAEKFKQDLAELVQQGAASVPAIREFLEKNVEFDYSQLNGGDQLGYSSFRASLFDTLKQIGGPEAQATMLHALQTTALPSEMLELAKNLDQGTPGAYHEQVLNAARDALNMASANQLGTNVEVGPAFRVLQTYGDANTLADAAKNDPVTFYNALNLANLPDGGGLESLVQMAQNASSGSPLIATEMIAQLAGQNSQALDALLQMAQKGQISNGTWMKLAPILGGDQFQVNDSTGQDSGNVSVVNHATTPSQINERITMIDKLLGFIPADSSAARALNQEHDLLVAKLGN